MIISEMNMLLTDINFGIKLTRAAVGQAQLCIVQFSLNLVSFVGPVQHLPVLLQTDLSWGVLVVSLVALVDNIVFVG